MYAKSITEHFPVHPPSVRPHWTRKYLTLFVFLVSFTALGLLLHERYGMNWLQSAYAVVQDEASTASKMVLLQPAPPVVNPDATRQQALAEFLGKRYKVSQDVTLELVEIAHVAAKAAGLDPLLIMAVIGVESRYNPIAESEAGAKGLMQIIPKYHGDKLAEFGGDKAVFNPESNIRVGTRILKEYLSWTGNISIALQMYAGALDDNNDIYTNRVLGEKQRLQRVVASLSGTAPTATRLAQLPREVRRNQSPLGE